MVIPLSNLNNVHRTLQYNTLEMDSVHREMGDALSRAGADHGSRIKQVRNVIIVILSCK